MSTKMFEVQQAIFQHLSLNKDLTGIVTGIFDFVPEKTVLPYVTFGEIHSQPLTSKVENGETVMVSIDAWSETKGRKEVAKILYEIEKKLETELTVPGVELISQKITNRKSWEESYGLFTGQIDIEVKIMWEEL